MQKLKVFLPISAHQTVRSKMTSSGIETEVKIRLPEINRVVDRLKRSGFEIGSARKFESNTLYDTSDRALRRGGMILRLRQSGDHSVITWKGPAERSPFKSRPELETTVGSLETMRQILEHLGFEPAFEYEKYRTEYMERAQPEAGTLTIDETPIGNFLELEGPGDWIDQKARVLGFSREDYLLESYGQLYLDDCRKRGVEPTRMVFASNSR
jgi:adenylate cyclase class 2